MALCKIRPDFPVLKEKDINVVRSLIKDASWIIAAVDNLRVVGKNVLFATFDDNKISFFKYSPPFIRNLEKKWQNKRHRD